MMNNKTNLMILFGVALIVSACTKTSDVSRLEVVSVSAESISTQTKVSYLTPPAASELVYRFYRAILDRESDSGGHANHLQSVLGGGWAAVSNTIEVFVNSSEYQERIQSRAPEDILRQLYRGFFERDPDESGTATFLPMIQQNRTSEVATILAKSDEMRSRLNPFKRHEDRVLSEAVHRLYAGFLGRNPDEGGLRSHTEHIRNLKLRGWTEVVRGIFSSPEAQAFLATLDDRTRLGHFYENLFNRPMDSSGEAAYLPMIQAGQSEEVAMILTHSQEYVDRVEQAVPEIVDPPSGYPKTHPRNFRSDFLTLRLEDGSLAYISEYPGYSEDKRRAVRAALRKRGYTYILVNPHHEYQSHLGSKNPAPYSFFENPGALRPFLEEIYSSGLHTVLAIGLEDSKKAQAQYPPRQFAEMLKRFIPAIDDRVSSYMMGVEIDEYWKSESDQRLIGSTLRSLTQKDIFVHFTPGVWAGKVGDERGWWSRNGWATGLFYQYGFGLSESNIRSRTQELVRRLHEMNKLFIASEYALNIPESEAQRLGAVALEAGADGFTNGGPAGYADGGNENGQDEMNLHEVEFLHTNVAGWRITSSIADIRITPDEICVQHTQAGRWPVITNNGTAIEGNPWVVAQVNGRWYAATYEWLRPGQICKGITASNIGGHIKKHPLESWQPKSGERVGFFISTPARSGPQTVQERSNLVFVTWP